ncbi:MAG: Ig-like domain-containing protein, partial [Anaerolineae bacterium]
MAQPAAPISLIFNIGLNATSLTTGTWTDVNSLDFITPNITGSVGARDGNDPANRAVPNTTITGLAIANGTNFWLRWNDFNASGADDSLAIDNFTLTPLVSTAAVSANKNDTLVIDSDGDTQADPGDTLSYTINITNSGTTASGVVFSDTLDANTSQNGLVSISPVAIDDTYNASANPVTLSIPDGASDLFTNDYAGLNPLVTGITSFGGGALTGDAGTNAAGSTVTFGSGGSLTVNANGSFNFTPPTGYQGVFGFFYRLQNSLGPSDGLVTITVDAPPIVSSTTPTNGATNVNAASNITLNFSESVNIAAGGITLNCGAGAVSFTPALPQNGVTTLALDPTVNLPGNATCTVTILAANVTDTDTNDPPNQLDGNNDGVEGDNYVFSFQVAPTANDDSYNVTPHLTLNSPTSVRANDDPTTVTITGFGNSLGTANGTVPNGSNSITTGLGGTVILNTDGTFIFNPPPNQRNVNDAFFYTVTGGDTATVTLAIQNQNLVWFVDASASPSGNGTQARPFNLLTGAGSFNTVASDNTGDFIFIADGSYTCGLTLLNSQTVVGDGSSSSLQIISGVTPVSGSSFPAFSGTDPTLSNASGDCLTLGSGNTIRGLTIGNTSATGSDITGTNFGTLAVTETTLNGTGRALNLNNGTFNATLDGLTSTSGTNNVNLVSVGGTANLGSGALSGASSDAFVVNGGTGSITYTGSIANTAARIANLTSQTGGLVTLGGNLSCSTACTGLNVASNTGGTMNFSGASKIVNIGAITAVTLSNNTGATINFTGGGLAVTTTSGQGFNASGGGTVTVQGTGNTINSTTGIALNVVNTTIGASGLTFQSISANGAANGIVLNNTGSGGLTVTGNGGSCSSATPTCTGGTIANVTDTGISLTNASNVTLTRMRLQNSPNFGLNGSTINTLNIDTCLFDGTHGSAIDEGALFVTNWFGSGTISNSEITGGFNDNVRVNNTASGTLNRLTVSNTTIRNSGNNHGFAFYGCLNGSAGSCPATTMNLSVLNSTFTDNSSNSVNISLASATSSDVVLQGNLFQSTSLVTVGGPGGSVLLAIDHSSTMTLDVNGNTFTNPRLSAFTAFISNQTTSAASMVGKIRNNII